MGVYENYFNRALDRKFWLNLKKTSHYKIICQPVRSECSFCRVSFKNSESLLFDLEIQEQKIETALWFILLINARPGTSGANIDESFYYTLLNNYTSANPSCLSVNNKWSAKKTYDFFDKGKCHNLCHFCYQSNSG